MRLFAVAFAFAALGAQSDPAFTHALAGNPDDAASRGTGSCVLAGGGTDQPEAFKWMIERAGGGDVVIIRASGSDAYHKWILDLGGADSVETIIVHSRAASSDPFAGRNTAYFLRPTALPEHCEPGKPLTLRGVNVYRIDSTGSFDLAAWRGTGGLAYSLDTVNGVVTSSRDELY